MRRPITKRKARDFALLGRVWAEVGAGRITDAFIYDGKLVTEGLYSGSGHITINQEHGTVDSLIHECLHRAFPAWSENYVRRTTTYLRRRMTDDEVHAMYEEFLRRSKKRKRPLRINGEES